MSVVFDRETVDFSRWKPRLVSELLFWPCIGQSAKATPDMAISDASLAGHQKAARYRIEIPSQNKFFDIGYQEYILISMFDGGTTVAAACGKAAQALGSAALTQQQANAIARWLLRQGLAIDDDEASSASRGRPLSDERSEMLARLNPFWIKIPLGRAERLLPKIAGACGFLFSIPAMILACLTVLVALLVVVAQWPRLAASASGIFSPDLWLLSLTSWIFLKVLHEIGHAAAAQRFGCRITDVGVVLVLFAPLAYVDVTTSWRLRSRWQRIIIAAGGMYVELLIASIAAIVWGFVDAPMLSHQLFCLMLAASVSTVLFNANPLMRFDGYFILTDLINLPNLASEGTLSLRDLASRLFYAKGVRREYHLGWRRVFVPLYGIAALAWRILICITLSIAAAMLFHGGGIALVGIAMIMWVLRPIQMIVRSIGHQADSDPPSVVRAFVVAGCLCVIGTYLVFYAPVPSAIVAPAIVDQADDSVVRSACDGFIDTIHVVDGERVRRNDLLFSLRNDELRQQYQELQMQIEQSEIRQRTAAQTQDIAGMQIEQERCAGLNERLSQLQVEIDGLTVRAPRDGTIIARRLHDQLGRFVSQGDALLKIADLNQARILTSIAQADVRQALSHVGGGVQIRLASATAINGTLLQIKPLASTNVPSMALAGNNQGPLPVRRIEEGPTDENAYRLLEPRFEAIVEMDTALNEEIPLGQTARVWIGYRSQTLHQRASAWLRRLINTHRSPKQQFRE
ncbi:MAG: efflux RND transporter periplasmic adaptor subunit [Pirellulaceae bacterium]